MNYYLYVLRFPDGKAEDITIESPLVTGDILAIASDFYQIRAICKNLTTNNTAGKVASRYTHALMEHVYLAQIDPQPTATLDRKNK